MAVEPQQFDFGVGLCHLRHIDHAVFVRDVYNVARIYRRLDLGICFICYDLRLRYYKHIEEEYLRPAAGGRNSAVCGDCDVVACGQLILLVVGFALYLVYRPD